MENSILTITEEIAVALIVLFGLILGFWVWGANRKEKLNLWFLAMAVSVVLWTAFSFLGSSTKNTSLSAIFYRLNFGAVAFFLFSSFYFYVIHFLNNKESKKYKILGIFIFFVGAILIYFSVFTNFIIEKTISRPWGSEIVFGPANLFFNIYAFLTAFLVVGLPIKKYFHMARPEKLKTQYFLIGTTLFAVFNIVFNIIFPIVKKTVEFYPFGDYSAIFLIGFTAFAIVKRNLFGMRVVLTALLVGAIAILLSLDTFVFTPQLLIQLFKGLVLVIFLYFGYLLIKNILNEIKRREELERVTAELEIVNVKLDAAYQSLKKLDDAKSEFISIASHQLRAPLTAIRGYTSMVLEGSYGKITQKSIGPLENILKSSDRLIKLVNDLLSISRIESGKMELELEKISFVELVKDAAKELEIGAKNKNIYLRVEELKEILPQVFIDKDKIRQVILNIIDNAIKYTNKGGVDISFKKGGGTVLAKISDTGIGFEKEEMEKMFSSFSRGSGKEVNTEGAGLGLYTARKFIEIHKGKIWAESAGKGKGSAFFIELPTNISLKTKF